MKGMSGSVTPIDNSSLILVGEDGEDVSKIAEKLTKKKKKKKWSNRWAN